MNPEPSFKSNRRELVGGDRETLVPRRVGFAFPEAV